MPHRRLTDRATPRMLDAVSSTQDDDDDLQGLFPPPPPVAGGGGAQRQFHRVGARLFGEEETPLMLGRWTIGDLIDVGGMGRVYRAFDPALGREVAVKTMQFGAGADLDRRRRRMLREAQAMAAVRHRNVVQVYDVEVSDAQVFVVMELVRGQTLAAWLGARSRRWQEIVEVFIAAGEGLAASHDVKVIHRDFKPDNVLIDENGQVKVIDFGLACVDGTIEGDRAGGALAASLTVEGTIVGTLNYSAPEQLRGEEVSARSDQFSFCRALYESLYEVRPFVGDTAAELLAAMAAGEPDFAGSRRIPRRIRATLRRGLSFVPARRFDDMHALLRQLRDAAKPSPLRWLALTPVLLWPLCAPHPSTDACRALQADAAHLQQTASLARAGATSPAARLSAPDHLWSRFELRWMRHVGAWYQASEDLCRSAGESESASQPRVACLRDHGASLSALADELTRPTTDLLANLDVHLLDLDERLARCTSLAGVAPSDASPAKVRHVRGLLARAWASERAGKLRLARIAAEEARQEAEASGDAGLLAEAELQRGRVLGLLHDPGARPVLERARDLALGDGDLMVALDAALFLYKFAAEVLEDTALALRQEALLHPLVHRLGDPPWRRSQLADARGLVLRFAGEPEAAEAAHDEALALIDALLGDGSAESLRIELNRLTARAEASDTNEDELAAQYLALLGRVSRQLGERHPLTVSVRRELALTLYDQDALESAAATAQAARAVARMVYGEDSRDVAVLDTLLARLFFDDERPAAAEWHASVALAHLEALAEPDRPDSDRVAALSVLGDIAFGRGEFVQAAKLYERGASLAERLPGRASQQALEMGNNAAYALYAAGQNAEAASRLDALAAQIERHELAFTNLGMSIYGNRGLAYSDLDRGAARGSLTRALAIADGLEDPALEAARRLYSDALVRLGPPERSR
ncbi:Serine/threonine-protein kinase PrkC [Nannocystis exedens]|nr:Serine/threonine-protein kinase PrkC [Nannocystis exedens]